jgi:hypothetical protein
MSRKKQGAAESAQGSAGFVCVTCTRPGGVALAANVGDEVPLVFDFRPGRNRVESGALERASADPLFKRRVEAYSKDGVLVASPWEGSEPPAPAPTPPAPVAPAGPTVADVKASTDRAQLSAWFDANPPESVADAILERLKELDK